MADVDLIFTISTINTCIKPQKQTIRSQEICFKFTNQDNALVSVEQESMVVKEGLHQGGKGAEVVSVHTTETINFLSIFSVGSLICSVNYINYAKCVRDNCIKLGSVAIFLL